MFKLNKINYLLFLVWCSGTVWANEVAEDVAQENVAEVVVKGKRVDKYASPFRHGSKVSDVTIQKEQFTQRSANLGEALSQELGIHSNTFGAGASSPIIRGQEGVRVKVLQGGSDVVDMSHLSPDHASVVDTLLAKQVEILRGTPTLLYANASSAGVVNVQDQRIPDRMPKKAYEGELALRYNTASQEKLANLGVTLGLGNHLALRLEGLQRQSENYRVPYLNINPQTRLNYMPDTYSQSKVFGLGVSWIGEWGYLGAAYNKRQDHYGLPAHNHAHDETKPHIIRDEKSGREFLEYYPHLHEEQDLSPHYHGGPTSLAKPADEQHQLGYGFDHTKRGPWVDLNSNRYDVRGEWKINALGLDKIRFNFAKTDYYHDEKDAGKDHKVNVYSSIATDANKGRANNIFINQGKNLRLEIHHADWHGLKGVWGIQRQTSENSAYHSKISQGVLRQNWMLTPNTQKVSSIFGVEQLRWRDWVFELGMRREKQLIDIQYDPEKLKDKSWRCRRLEICRKIPTPEIYHKSAHSYSLSSNWEFLPDHLLSFNYAHQERHPSPMELYYTGEHLATNSFEYGNKNLDKERSNQLELGWSYRGDKWDYLLNVYQQDFANYIYKQVIFQEGTLATYRYAQSKAKFKGLEWRIRYRPNDRHQITVSGDYVRGKLRQLPDYVHYDVYGSVDTVRKKADRNAPRVPPMRLSVRLDSKLSDNWHTFIAYTRVFKQNKTTFSESFNSETPNLLHHERATKGHHLLNLGLSYHRHIGNKEINVFLNANNVLNQQVYQHTSFLPYVPQMGRHFLFGVNMKF